MVREIGIIGYPLGHTLSPRIHESAFDALNLDIKFTVWETELSNLDKIINNLRSNNILGSCVTLPYKQEVIKYIDQLDKTAIEMDAVNWIVNKKGILKKSLKVKIQSPLSRPIVEDRYYENECYSYCFHPSFSWSLYGQICL